MSDEAARFLGLAYEAMRTGMRRPPQSPGLASKRPAIGWSQYSQRPSRK